MSWILFLVRKYSCCIYRYTSIKHLLQYFGRYTFFLYCGNIFFSVKHRPLCNITKFNISPINLTTQHSHEEKTVNCVSTIDFWRNFSGKMSTGFLFEWNYNFIDTVKYFYWSGRFSTRDIFHVFVVFINAFKNLFRCRKKNEEREVLFNCTFNNSNRIWRNYKNIYKIMA